MSASQDFNGNEFLLFNWKSVDMGMILLVYSVLHVDNLFWNQLSYGTCTLDLVPPYLHCIRQRWWRPCDLSTWISLHLFWHPRFWGWSPQTPSPEDNTKDYDDQLLVRIHNTPNRTKHQFSTLSKRPRHPKNFTLPNFWLKKFNS